MTESANLSSIYNNLIHLGDYYPLEIIIEKEEADNAINNFKEKWQPYNPRKENKRFGLSLTSHDGSIDGPNQIDLDSLHEYNKLHNTSFEEDSFKTKTSVFKSFSKLQKDLEPISQYICRSHIIKLNAGGFFPPHRDLDPKTFRLISLSNNCSISNFVLLLNNQRIFLDQQHLYFLNTRVAHSVFSFEDDVFFFIFNILVNIETASFVRSKLLEK